MEQGFLASEHIFSINSRQNVFNHNDAADYNQALAKILIPLRSTLKKKIPKICLAVTEILEIHSD